MPARIIEVIAASLEALASFLEEETERRRKWEGKVEQRLAKLEKRDGKKKG